MASKTPSHRLQATIVLIGLLASLVATALVVCDASKPTPAVASSEGKPSLVSRTTIVSTTPEIQRAPIADPDLDGLAERAIAIVVRDDRGSLIQDAVISKTDTPDYFIDSSRVLAKTNGEGRAVILVDELGDDRSLVVSKVDYVPTILANPADGSTTVVILESGSELRVRVIDQAGKPVSGVRLGYSSSQLGGLQTPVGMIAPSYSKRGPRVLQATADQVGEAVFRGLRPGFCSVWPVDSFVVFTAESARRAHRLVVPEDGGEPALATIVVGSPLVAFWRYVDDSVVDHACAFQSSAARNQRLERQMVETHPGSVAVVLSETTMDVAPL